MKRFYVLMVLIIIAITFSNCSKNKNSKQGDIDSISKELAEQKDDYFNPADYTNSTETMGLTLNAIKKINEKLLKGSFIRWGDSETGKLFLYDTYSNKPYSEIIDSKRVLYYKVENKRLYISEDNKNWEKVSVKVINDNPPKPKNKNEFPVVLIIDLECKWFKGEYELWDTTD